MLVIDDELRELIESGPAISIGTRSATLVPHAVRGWGGRVAEDGRTVDIFIDKPGSDDLLADVRDNARIAACFVNVLTFRSLQLKGRCVEVKDPEPDDWAWVDRHREAFTSDCEVALIPPEVCRHLWSMQVMRVRFVVDEFFDQTPGPGAGRAI
jgi:Pyridoxamine 5'-phosphate oxidase